MPECIGVVTVVGEPALGPGDEMGVRVTWPDGHQSWMTREAFNAQFAVKAPGVKWDFTARYESGRREDDDA